MRYQRSEQALIVAIMEIVVNGVSTRKVALVTKELCGTESSKCIPLAEGCMLGDTEFEESLTENFSWLKKRGLRGVDLIVTDDHGGLVRSIRQQLQGVNWQRCQTHVMRNILDAARMLFNQTMSAYSERGTQAMRMIETGFVSFQTANPSFD
jgi:transposase-like protein